MSEPVEPTPRSRSRWRRAVVLVALVVLAYLAAAYLVLPLAWTRYTRHHPALDDVPGITLAPDGIPGDPLNVALIGSEEELKRIMLAAGWHPADALTFRSCLTIAAATVLRRPYTDAPVSNLYLFGRKEDLAFEHPMGNDPRRRHHVRFWRLPKTDPDGRAIWIGAATFDTRVGFSHTTGQITHHIGADVDAERDKLFADLGKTGSLAETYWIDHFHAICQGRNGGGDPWRTDGRLQVGLIRPNPVTVN